MLRPSVFHKDLTKILIPMPQCQVIYLFCINDPIAATIHISIKKYRIVVPMPSINIRKAVRILSSKLIGNKIIFIIHLIISYSSLPNSYFVSPHTISMQT